MMGLEVFQLGACPGGHFELNAVSVQSSVSSLKSYHRDKGHPQSCYEREHFLLFLAPSFCQSFVQ